MEWKHLKAEQYRQMGRLWQNKLVHRFLLMQLPWHVQVIQIWRFSLVRKAASVSHDGIALEAACHLAALESMAFEGKILIFC